MEIVILNGNPDPKNNKFDKYLENLSSILNKNKNHAVIIKLREKKINYCIGCYSCWLKTPGICIHKDDGPKILMEYLNSDIVIFSSPIIMGFISSLLKSVQERLLPILHPFVYVLEDRMQHISRYKKYPAIALLLEKKDKNDNENIEIIEKVIKSARTRKFLFTKSMDINPREVAIEINSI